MVLRGPIRTAAAAAVVLALLSGCGQSERDSARERVGAYVSAEQDVMRRAEPQFRRADETFRAYARAELSDEAAARGAAKAKRAISGARDAVSALDPPAEAQALHTRLDRYLQLNIEVAHETERLAVYTPAAERVLRRLARANGRLEDRLAAAAGSEAQVDALARFGAAVDAALTRLRRLDPPTVLRPAHDGQLRPLVRTRRLTAGLRRALRDRDAEAVARLLKRFRAGAAQPRAPRLASAQALAQYNRRLEAISTAYDAIRREQAVLARSLQ